MGFKATTQIILVIVSLVVIFTYIKPALLDIRTTQDELFQYSNAIDTADQLSALLSDLLATVSSFSASNLAALYEYLPDEVDTVQVMADISAIADKQGIRVVSLEVGDLELPQENVVLEGEEISTSLLSFVDFDIKLNGSYESMKSFLKTLEQNKYPLEIMELSFGNGIKSEDEVSEVSTVTDTINQDYQIVVRAYAYTSPALKSIK